MCTDWVAGHVVVLHTGFDEIHKKMRMLQITSLNMKTKNALFTISTFVNVAETDYVSRTASLIVRHQLC